MKAIIVGAGEVGYHIADRLSREGHQITIVERDSERGKLVNEKVNALVVNGNGSSPSLLEQIGISEVDLFIAVTSIDEVNLVACLLAKQYHVPHIIGRVRSTEYTETESKLSAETLGIDLLINPQDAVASDICSIISYSKATEVVEFAEGKIIFVSFLIFEESSITGISLKELGEKRGSLRFNVASITRHGVTLIPRGDDYFEANDTVSFVCHRDDYFELQRFLGFKAKDAKNIFILGGGHIGYELAKRLSDGKHTVKVIDRNRSHCEMLSASLDGTLILCAESTDVETLKNEGISRADAFVAVTNDDQANILGALLAKKNGVKRAISLVNQPELLNLAPGLGIDVCISPRLSTASAILKYIRGEKVFRIAMLEQDDAEVVELQINEGASILQKPIHSLNIPSELVIGAIVRNGEAIIPSGSDHLEAGDHVIVFCLADGVKKSERFFL